MFRIIYSVLLPFLTPFALYWLTGRFPAADKRESWPLKTLTAAGLGLVLIFLFVFSVPDKAPADSAYTPPRFENGKIIPAQMNRKNDAD